VPLAEAVELHQEAHELLLAHVQKHRRRDARLMEEREALLTRLEVDVQGLREAPSLGDAPSAAQASSLLSSAPDVVREAKRRHADRMRALKAPWWRGIEEANRTSVPVHDIFFANHTPSSTS
jgi:hypothetical protein